MDYTWVEWLVLAARDTNTKGTCSLSSWSWSMMCEGHMKSVSSGEDIRAENWGPKGNSQYGVRRGFREKRILELGLN